MSYNLSYNPNSVNMLKIRRLACPIILIMSTCANT